MNRVRQRINQDGPTVDQNKTGFSFIAGKAISCAADHWRAVLALVGLAVILGLQTWAYSTRFHLSLGPRVILQPWLIQRGAVIYENILDIHTPMMTVLMAALRYFVPDGFVLAKLTLLALIALSTILTFLCGKQKIGWLGALWAAWFFMTWSQAMNYGKLWYETFLAPIYLFWFLVYQAPDQGLWPGSAAKKAHETGASSSYDRQKSIPLKKQILFGLLGGVSVLIKQHAALVFLVFMLWQAYSNWSARKPASSVLKEFFVTGLSAFIPLLAYIGYQYTQAGTLGGFYYWMVEYHFYGIYTALSKISPTLAQMRILVSAGLVLPATLALGLYLKRRGNHLWFYLFMGLLIIAAGSVAAFPRFEFYHLQPILPVLAVLTAMTLAQIVRSEKFPRYFALSILAGLSIFWGVTQGSVYLEAVKQERPPVIFEYSNLQPLAKKIRSITGWSKQIYIFPDDEGLGNLYYILDAKPPKFWGFHYPWYLLDEVKTRVLSTLDQSPPRWVVYFPGRWDIEYYFPEAIDYLQDNYVPVADFLWYELEVRILKRSVPTNIQPVLN